MRSSVLISLLTVGVGYIRCCCTLVTVEMDNETLTRSAIENHRIVIAPPAVLVFEHPANGSTVHGTHAVLNFTFRSSRAGQAFTPEEISVFGDNNASICFAVRKASIEEHTHCVELTTDMLSSGNLYLAVGGLLPGIWHTIVATFDSMKASAKGESGVIGIVSDSLTILVALESNTTMCGDSVCLDSSAVRASYFDMVYRGRIWGDTRSGIGSTVSKTAEIRLGLEEVIRNYGIASMLDAPCGDLTWMPLVRGIDQVRYTGADISVSVVEENQRNFLRPRSNRGWGENTAITRREPGEERRAGGFQGAVFVQADLVEEVPLSMDGEPYDLIFVRDAMIHLAPRHNLRILENVETSDARFLMASTFLNGDENWDADTFIPLGGHLLNLSLPPYCLRPPIAFLPDTSTERADQRMGLWELNPARPLIGSKENCGQGGWD